MCGSGACRALGPMTARQTPRRRPRHRLHTRRVFGPAEIPAASDHERSRLGRFGNLMYTLWPGVRPRASSTEILMQLDDASLRISSHRCPQCCLQLSLFFHCQRILPQPECSRHAGTYGDHENRSARRSAREREHHATRHARCVPARCAARHPCLLPAALPRRGLSPCPSREGYVEKSRC